MIGFPREAAQLRTVCRRAAALAWVIAASATGVVWLLHPDLVTVMGYGLYPLLVAIVAWTCVGAMRLRLVGFLPSSSSHFIPPVLQPSLRIWQLLRLALFGAIPLLLAAVIGSAVAGLAVIYAGQALVYVVAVRILLDLVFGAVFNLGIISRRKLSR